MRQNWTLDLWETLIWNKMTRATFKGYWKAEKKLSKKI